LQKTISNIDKDIKDYTLKLKELLAKKQGITLEQLEYRQKEKSMKSHNLSQSTIKFIKEKKINVQRFRDITFKFRCPECKGRNTKRNGTTCQINTKARFLCFDCKYKRQVTNDTSITPFFVLSNDEMIAEINASKKLSKNQKKDFHDKYVIRIQQEKI